MSTPINFRDLKKELRDVEKLTRENLDVKSWSSDLKLWIDLQKIQDKKIIYTACVLTSTGEPRQIIQELLENSKEEDSSDEDSDSSDGSTESEDTEDEYPSLKQVVEALETFYGLKEDQGMLLRELRALRIRKNEKIKDFNLRYKTLYLKLDKKRKRQISVLDYADSLQGNLEAWKKVSLKDNISLTKAFSIAEKVDRLTIKSTHNTTTFNNTQSSRQRFIPKLRNSSSPTVTPSNYTSSVSTTSVNSNNTLDSDMADLTKKMRNLSIKACYFCQEQGHFQNNCPKLRSILEKNRQELNHLNH